MLKLKDGDYNLRLTVKNNKMKIGFVHKLYKNKEGFIWKNVPRLTKKKIDSYWSLKNEKEN